MKRFIAILLSLLMLTGCFIMGVSAADAEPVDPEEPEIVKTDSGFYKGQIFAVGDKIKSVHEECDMLTVKYSIGTEDKDHVTSALQKTYADSKFNGVVSFRDTIASFSTGDTYKGEYTIAGVGSTVTEMETKNGEFKSAAEILSSLTTDEQKKLKNGITLKIDYEHDKETLIQYTTLTGWEIVDVMESSTSLEMSLRAIYTTRERSGFENFLEKLYTKWLGFLDKVGDLLIPVVPKVVEFWARLLGKNR